jgi:hypothetical protein
METKQTAVDIILHEMSEIIGIISPNAFDVIILKELYKKAKQMEKEQIKKSYNDCHNLSHIYGLDSEKYYNETYGKAQ